MMTYPFYHTMSLFSKYNFGLLTGTKNISIISIATQMWRFSEITYRYLN